jgi:drug/metabolite transporter (DMT)-like permease
VSERLRLKTRIFVAIVVLANVFGNFFMSWGVKRRGSLVGLSLLEYVRVILDPWVAFGITLLIVWMLSRMALLSWADLSYVLPVTAAGYVLTAVAGHVLLGERLSAGRWAGTALITAGVLLVGATDPLTRERKP